MNEDGLSFNRRAVRPLACLREGWRLIKDDYWLFFGITAVGVLMGNAAPLGLLLGPIMCGIHLCLLRREAGQRVTFDMLFQGFNYFGQSLIAVLIMIVPALLLVGTFYAAFFVILFATIGTANAQPQGQPVEMTATWVFLAAYPVLIVGMLLISALLGALFIFTFPLIVDRGLSGVEATKLSARAALANLGGVVGLMLLTWLMAMVGVLACYIGVFLMYPVAFAMIAVAYRQVFPADYSVLYEPPPPQWPELGERAAGLTETGIQGQPDRPPTEPGIMERRPDSGQGELDV